MDDVDRLCRELVGTKWSVRSDAAAALGRMGDARAVELLCQALADANEQVRICAAQALGEIGDARAVEPLCRALGDSSEQVRESAAEALGRIGRRPGLPALRARLRHRLLGGEPDQRVRAAIQEAIRQIEQATAGTRALPRAVEVEAPSPAGLPRAEEETPEPEGRPRAG